MTFEGGEVCACLGLISVIFRCTCLCSPQLRYESCWASYDDCLDVVRTLFSRPRMCTAIVVIADVVVWSGAE